MEYRKVLYGTHQWKLESLVTHIHSLAKVPATASKEFNNAYSELFWYLELIFMSIDCNSILFERDNS